MRQASPECSARSLPDITALRESCASLSAGLAIDGDGRLLAKGLCAWARAEAGRSSASAAAPTSPTDPRPIPLLRNHTGHDCQTAAQAPPTGATSNRPLDPDRGGGVAAPRPLFTPPASLATGASCNRNGR